MEEFNLGDVVLMKKQHPCGSSEWEIIRLGADIKIKCEILKHKDHLCLIHSWIPYM